jgi:hypothetical protein
VAIRHIAKMNDEHETPAGLRAVYGLSLEPEVMNTRKFAKRNPGYWAGQLYYYFDGFPSDQFLRSAVWRQL